MLKKLLKYDLKYMLKNMVVFYILGLFFSLTTRILFSLKQTVIINVLGQISVGFVYSMTASILFNTVIRSWVRFKDSLYKDESYLTHTLPVTKKELYISKLLESLIFSIIGFIIVLICLFITYYTDERYLLLKSAINSISNGLNLNTWFIVISIVVIFFLEIFNILQNGFLGIILGNKKNNNKIIFSFLYGFISYIISQAFVVLVLFIIGLFNKSVMSIFTSNILINNDIIKLLIFLAIIIYIVIITIMSNICIKEFNKGVNIE